MTLKKPLTPEEYEICILKGTETPFTGKYNHHKEPGIYKCTCCETPLFSSENKYDSGSGWPSFFRPLSENVIATQPDNSLPDRPRIEILCATCGSHLGHVFDDGPNPTGKRFCVNSVSLKFSKK